MKFIVIAFILCTSAFAQSGPQQKERAAISGLVKSIQVLAENDLSCKEATDCKGVFFGSRACGGPSGYVVTSKDNGNMAEVDFLVKSVTEKEEVYNVTYRVVSICSVISPPKPKCLKKICTL